jgi:hypothetical protein
MLPQRIRIIKKECSDLCGSCHTLQGGGKRTKEKRFGPWWEGVHSLAALKSSFSASILAIVGQRGFEAHGRRT